MYSLTNTSTKNEHLVVYQRASLEDTSVQLASGITSILRYLADTDRVAGVVRTVFDGVSRLSVGAADGTRVDIEDWARDGALGVFQLVRRVDGFRLAVVSTEDAYLACRRRRRTLLLQPTGLGPLQTFSLSQDFDQLGLRQDVFHCVGRYVAAQCFAGDGRRTWRS